MSSTINRLFACGCEVIYEQDKEVHVSGHAAREELKLVLSMVRPKYFVPVHGEFRHQVRHAQLAEEMGVLGKNVFVLHVGRGPPYCSGQGPGPGFRPSGSILVDGIALGEMEGSLLKDAGNLPRRGVLAVSL